MSEKTKKKKNKIPHHKRHVFLLNLLKPLVWIYLKLKFNYKYKKAKNLPKNYIVVSNHTTDFDPIFVSMSFKKQMYFVASEHITRWKKAYKFLNFVFAPIIRRKGTVASATAMEILRRTKRGANVCLFAEGVRSWNGKTGEIIPSTAKLIKSSGCALVTYKIVGGYFVSPNWSEGKTRKGYIHGSPVNVYTKEQISTMTENEIMDILNKDLYEDAYLTQKEKPRKYTGKRLAEKLENLIFICPHCKHHDSLTSQYNTVGCSKCGKTFTYDEHGMLNGVDSKTIYELSSWQENEIDLDIQNNTEYTSNQASLYEIKDNHERIMLASGSLSMTPQKLTCGDVNMSTNEIYDMAIFGKHGVAFSSKTKNYEIIVDGNAYKYVLLFKHINKQKAK